MANEPDYSPDTNNTGSKRKYDEQTTAPSPPARRRPTGFSSGPISPDSADHAPPPSYNSVPPATDEVSLYKQRAQEIAARLMSGGGGGVGAGTLDAKRPRVENGAGGGYDGAKGFSSAPPDMRPQSTVSYNSFQGSTKKIDIPSNRVGLIIGKGGETIKYLQLQSGAKIQVARDMDADPSSTNRSVDLTGTPEQVAKAEQLINDVISEAESGGSGMGSRRLTTGQAGSDHFVMKIPNNKVGLVIGKGGETIKNFQARTGARIQVIPLHLPPGDTSTERTVQIDGTKEQIDHAKQLVDEVTSENRFSNPGYSQQGYQTRPASNWGPSGGGSQMTQPGYGYTQPQYGGYPPQQQASGGYASGWDQSTQQATQGYDYYGGQQQQSSQTPADSTGYNYNQAPAAASGYNQQGQGYTHNGYYQSGYGQVATSYDQQQQSYGATVTNPPQDGPTPSYGAQGESAQQPSSNTAASYPQGSSQSGYEVPPTSQSGYPAGSYGPPQGQKAPANPATYGQTQQSPSNPGPGGYSQPGYPSSQQSGYAQGYGPTTSYGGGGYGYSAAAAASSYGSGYPPQAYSADAAASHDTTAPAASQSGVAKESPQS